MICYVYNKLGTEVLHKIHFSTYMTDCGGRVLYLKDTNNSLIVSINDLPYILKAGDLDDLSGF